MLSSKSNTIMFRSITEAMNEGAIPNIENTWNNMCMIESQKAFNDAESLYENILRDKFENNSINDELIKVSLKPLSL